MPLRKARGDMYPFITHTWNPIKGKCSHGCSYCYVDRIARRFGKEQTAPYLDVNDTATNLGKDKYIFVGSSIDMFASEIEDDDILRVLVTMQRYDNRYLLQTKNPGNMLRFAKWFPARRVSATTAETNRQYPAVMGNALPVAERLAALARYMPETMVTIEPIMDFDVERFAEMLSYCEATQINIGADSGNNGLPEPSAEKVRDLIDILARNGARVLLKKNLRRILPEHELYAV